MDKKYSLAEIEKEVNRLAAKIGAPSEMLPTYGFSRDFAYPHIEVDSHGYHYVIVERGQEIKRVTTKDLDVLLWNTFKDVTFDMACKYSASHRREDEDFRRLMFQRQVELLSTLSPDWAGRKSKEHEKILAEHPYDDMASIRAKLTATLREQGNSPEVAERIACQKYPLLNSPSQKTL
jgi:hypothetical protein